MTCSDITLVEIIGFVFIGVTMEVVCTAVMDFFKDRDPRLKGETYLWMLPVYACVPYIYVVVQGALPDLVWWQKGLVYMLAFYLLEFVAGLIIKALVGVSPWNYKNYKCRWVGH